MYTQILTRTNYTLLNSLIDIKKYVQVAKQQGATSIGIVDKNNLSGSVLFYDECLSNGLKPIIGLTVEYEVMESGADVTEMIELNNDFSDFEETQGVETADASSSLTQKKYTLTLLAKNKQSYLELMKISSKRMLNKTLSLEEILEEVSELVVVLDTESEFYTYALGDFSKIENHLLQFDSCKELYVAIPVAVDPYLVKVANQFNLSMIALDEVTHFQAIDAKALEVMKAIKEQKVLDAGELEASNQGALKSPRKMEELYIQRGLTNAIENLEKFVKECQIEIPLHQSLLPSFKVPNNQTAQVYLKEIAREGLKQKGKEQSEEYSKRLELELSVIEEMGFSDYFLIVWDLLEFARSQNIFTGFGRGSAAGSLVAYVLGITGVDPIQYGLLFERFLNKERYTMPDIDIDMPDDKREILLHYTYEKYGKEHVSQIATFQTLGAKSVLRDVCRVLGLSMRESDEWSAAVKGGAKATLETSLATSKAFRTLVEKNPRNTLVYEIALKLEGMPRNVSVHAAGVVISDKSLTEVIPLMRQGEDEISLTQCSMGFVEEIGLLKMDFLGLKNLKIIADVVQSLYLNSKEVFDPYSPDFEDEETLRLFQRGDTAGIFQFDSEGIRRVLMNLSPDSIDEIAVVNALYRPGPMENIDHFVKRKFKREKVTSLHPSIDAILESTYGIIVYQEQVMQVLVKMGGFTLGEADVVRRAIGKKKKEVIDEIRNKFVDGAKKNGIEESIALKVYDYIEKFANYGFNKSHAYAYSFVAYQMGYLKVHHSAAFFQCLMHTNRGNKKKVKEFVGEAKRFGVKCLLPSVNSSEYSFQLRGKNQIEFGLSEIKGLRNDVIQKIIDERKDSPFQDIDDFLVRIGADLLNLEILEALLFSGAFDCIHSNRQELFLELEKKYNALKFFGNTEGIFDRLQVLKEKVDDFDLNTKLEKEEEYLGISLSFHPTEQFKKIRRVKKILKVSEAVIEQVGAFLLQVRSVREIRTKRNEAMAFLVGSDDTGDIEVTVFPRVFREVYPLLEKGNLLLVDGKVEENSYSKSLQILANEIQEARMIEDSISDETIFLRVMTTEQLNDVKELLLKNKGNTPVVVVFGEERKKVSLPMDYHIHAEENIVNELKELLGNENVVLQEVKT